MESLTGWDIAAYVRFQRQTHKGTILIVEGDKDARIFKRILDNDQVSIQVSNGKDKAVTALDLLEEEGFPGVVALVDADFDHLESVTSDLEGLIITEMHDIDITIIESQAIEIFLEEYSDAKKLRACEEKFGTELRGLIYGAIRTLAYCRWASSRHDLMIDFKSMNYSFIAAASLNCDDTKLLDYLTTKSPAARCTSDELAQYVNNLRDTDHDDRRLCNGHDACEALGIALQQLVGKYRAQQVYGRLIEANLRLAFDYAAFRTTDLYAKFKSWENKQAGYTVLPVFN